jgi:hypothetical protein
MPQAALTVTTTITLQNVERPTQHAGPKNICFTAYRDITVFTAA